MVDTDLLVRFEAEYCLFLQQIMYYEGDTISTWKEYAFKQWKVFQCTEFVDFKQDNFRNLLGKKSALFA